MKKAIFTVRMAQYLVNRGFEVVDRAPNKDDLKREVYYFERSPELEAACNEYISTHRRENARPPITVSDDTLAKLYIVGKQSVETIAQVHGVSEDRVKIAVQRQMSKIRLLALSVLNDEEMQSYMNAKTDDERNSILADRIERGGFVVHTSRGNIEFPAKLNMEGVDGNE